MKVLQINTVYFRGGSTGRIAYDLVQLIRKEGIDGYAAYGEYLGEVNDDKTLCLQPHVLRRKLNILRTRLFDHHGFYNEHETRKLIQWMNEVKPDIVHLHNIHNHYVNVKILFDYIKQHEIPVVWTLHDCWSFTGHCAHFDYEKCEKWKSCCHDCTLLKNYPPTWFFDRTNRNFKDKKEAFFGVKNLTIVTPSAWLAGLTRDSFLKEYPVVVINNGISTDVFKPLDGNLIKKKLGIEGKKMVLAIMMTWQKNKGADYITSLPDYLDDDEILVIVGLKPSEISKMPQERCLAMGKTSSIQELAEYYSAADVFINPTLEDTFPTTNLESLACGTPIVTFRTGGSVESVTPETGVIVEQGDMKGLVSAVKEVLSKGKNYYSMACRNKAVIHYNKDKQYLKYIDLYRRIVNQ